MTSDLPKALIIGHSFVKRLYFDLQRGFDQRTRSDFHLSSRVRVSMFGVGGRTVAKIWKYDFPVISASSPDILVLELGTNDLSSEDPLVVASAMEVLVRYLHDRFAIKVICVCLVIPRHAACDFNAKVPIFNQAIQELLRPLSYVFCWFHQRFYNRSHRLLSHDGVHVGALGQYRLYRSYRVAVLKALSFL